MAAEPKDSEGGDNVNLEKERERDGRDDRDGARGHKGSDSSEVSARPRHPERRRQGGESESTAEETSPEKGGSPQRCGLDVTGVDVIGSC
eukprot:7301401-Pyramimonas_sp.AAC.2